MTGSSKEISHAFRSEPQKALTSEVSVRRDPRLRLEQLEDRTLLSTSTLEPAVAGGFVSGAEAGVTVVDIIPKSQSSETGQNSEPSIAVNPNDPNEAAISVFSDNPLSPFYSTKDGGKTWIQFDQLQTFDSTLSWSESGRLYLGRTSNYQVDSSGNLTQGTNEVDKSHSHGTPFQPIKASVYTSSDGMLPPDHPLIVAAQVDGTDHIYLGYNQFIPFNNQVPPTPHTATVRFSTDGGATWTTTVVDRSDASVFANAPAVPPAVNGNRVYVAFGRRDRQSRFHSRHCPGPDRGRTGRLRRERRVQRAGRERDHGGKHHIPVHRTPHGKGDQSLGNERVGSDLRLRSTRNPDHVYVAYADNPSPGRIQVQVQESTDGGRTWAKTFATNATPNFKSALPYLAVADNGAVGLLYTAQDIDHGVSFLETHFVQTGNDFKRSTDTLLSRFTDGNPPSTFDPYIGDYEGLKAVGNTFYGTFSASNQADGTHAIFPGGVVFQRDFTGTPGTSTFQLTDGSGNPVAASIDPYYFQIEASSGGD